MKGPFLPPLLSRRVPVFYGWIVLGCLCCAGFARQGPAVATLAQQIGLVAMPLIAQLAILEDGWRAGWLAIGATTLVVGFVPTWLLLVRRPEDLGLAPDGLVAPSGREAGAPTALVAVAEP